MASYPEIARSTSLELFVVACSESFLHRLGPPLSRRASRSCLQLRSELPRRRCIVCSHRVRRICPPGPISDEIVSKPGVALAAATSSQALLRRSELDGTARLHRSATTLVGYSRKTAQELSRFYNRRDRIPVLYLGLDHSVFNPETRAALRQAARSEFELPEDHLAVILVGNDWRNKGVLALLEALEQLRELPIKLFVVSREDPSACWGFVKEKKLENRVRFLAPRKDIEFYYAAADAYAGPSLQDSYGIPPAEAMACGLPVIVSASAGVCRNHHSWGRWLNPRRSNGFKGARDDDPPPLRRRSIPQPAWPKAAETARQYTWERNGLELAAIFEGLLLQKSRIRSAYAKAGAMKSRDIPNRPRRIPSERILGGSCRKF